MPLVDYRYAYLLGDLLIFFPIWLVLLIHRRDLLKELLLMSLAGGFFALLFAPYFILDYWRPELVGGWKIGIEDGLFGFFVAGIAAVVYEEICGKRLPNRKSRQKPFYLLALPIIIPCALASHFLISIAGINSIYSSTLVFIIVALIIIYLRRDLITDALVSGLFVGTCMLVGYLILTAIFPDLFRRFWLLGNISGVLVRGIPIEELLWGFSFGMVAGPFYEFMMGLKFARLTTSRQKKSLNHKK